MHCYNVAMSKNEARLMRVNQSRHWVGWAYLGAFLILSGAGQIYQGINMIAYPFLLNWWTDSSAGRPLIVAGAGQLIIGVTVITCAIVTRRSRRV